MSKLTQIRKALEDNKSIVVVAALEDNYLPGKCGYFSHTVDFYVAPKVGIYTVKELQAFMSDLIPQLKHSMQDDFWDSRDVIQFGKLYFDEEIGTATIHREITLIDPDMFSAEGFVNGKRVIDCVESLRRRTWVNLFPDVLIASDASKGKNRFCIFKEDLDKYRKTQNPLLSDVPS